MYDLHVSMTPTLTFLGRFGFEDPVKVPLNDTTVSVTCSTTKGDPDPFLTVSIVDLEGNKIRDLKHIDTLESGDSQAYKKRKTFALYMTENDVGKYVECNANQGYGFDVKVKKELAILCGCSEVGSSSNVCDPKNGKCECNPNFSGPTCHEYTGQFSPQCTGERPEETNDNGINHKYGTEVKLVCDGQNFEIQNCKWKKVDGRPCQKNSKIWENVYKKFSKKECSLNFQTLEIGHHGTYECELTSNETARYISKLKN